MDNQETIQDINKSTTAYLKENYLWHFIILCILVVGFYVFLIMSGNIHYAIYPFFIFLVLCGIAYNRAFTKMKHQFMQEFAASIGYSYSQKGEQIKIKGKFYKLGHSQSISDVLSGVHNNLPIKIFLFYFTVGYGKNSHRYCYTVFEITFHSKMPGIILNSKSWLSVTPYTINRGEHVHLEGDFNKYFDLWVTKEFEIEAFEIFTPDVMVALIDRAKNLNFEFIDDELYIYTGKRINIKEEMENIFSLVDYLIDIFSKKIPDIHIVDQNLGRRL